jgi:hypothetical protein
VRNHDGPPCIVPADDNPNEANPVNQRLLRNISAHEEVIEVRRHVGRQCVAATYSMFLIEQLCKKYCIPRGVLTNRFAHADEDFLYGVLWSVPLA